MMKSSVLFKTTISLMLLMSVFIAGCSKDDTSGQTKESLGTVSDADVANKPAQDMGDATGKIPANTTAPGKSDAEGPTTKDNEGGPGREVPPDLK